MFVVEPQRESGEEQTRKLAVALADLAGREGEISRRSDNQSLLLTFALTIAALIGAIAMEAVTNRLLLLLPPLSFALGMLWIDHAVVIHKRGEVIRRKIAPVLRELAGNDDRLLVNELVSVEHGRSSFTRHLPLSLPIATVFAVPPLVALGFATCEIEGSLWIWWFIGLGLVMTFLFFWALYALMPRSTRACRLLGCDPFGSE